MTSKCHSLEDLRNHLDQFGFRGEALASLREVSGLLTLESRPKGSDITFCKVFTHGKSHKAGVSKTVRPGHGTTITVHDFMYNMPVRRQRIRSAIDLEEIKSHIECTALMQPQVSVCRMCECYLCSVWSVCLLVWSYCTGVFTYTE